MSSNEVVVDVCNVSKRYEIYNTPRDRLKQLILPRLYQAVTRAGISLKLVKPVAAPVYFSEFWALRDVSFQVKRGETFGIIGRNGSGKSTLLQIIAGTLTPTHGEVSVHGRVAALLELGSGFNPEFTGRENVYLNGRILSLSQKEITDRFEQIVDFADIGEFIDQPVKTYSSGMFLRLAFAVQANIDASVVIIDEALAVGDVFFRQKCYARLEQLRNSGAAILLVTHAMTEIEQFCNNAILLDHGRKKFLGPSTEATKHYYLQNQPADNERIIFSTDQSSHAFSASCSSNCPASFWPNEDIFQSAPQCSQVGNGWGRCLRYAVCDENGKVCNDFFQGETAVFYYEFLLSNAIGVPLGGLVLQNERGINVHGKGSLEYGIDAPDFLPAGSIIRCRQCIELRVEIGEYSYELGLASIDPESYKKISILSYEQLSARILRICHLPKAGMISVRWRRVHEGSQLMHHGVADLPGKFNFQFETVESKNQ